MSVNGASFWVNLYMKKDNPHNERTAFIQKTFNNYYLNELNEKYHYGFGGFMFNDCDNLRKYSKRDIIKLTQYDRQIFKYYVKKMRKYRDKGFIFDENDEYYLNFINYFKTYV